MLAKLFRCGHIAREDRGEKCFSSHADASSFKLGKQLTLDLRGSDPRVQRVRGVGVRDSEPDGDDVERVSLDERIEDGFRPLDIRGRVHRFDAGEHVFVGCTVGHSREGANVAPEGQG